MSKLDATTADLHRKFYERFMDELDPTIIKEIMDNPMCQEALLLNNKVEMAIREYAIRNGLA